MLQQRQAHASQRSDKGEGLVCRGLTVTFDDTTVPALSDVTLDIPSTARVCVAGENGSGKSTLMHAACGIIPRLMPARVSGAVSLLGRSSDPSTPLEKFANSVSVLLQNPEVQFLGFSTYDELALAATPVLTPGTSIRRYVSGFMERYGLGYLLDRDPKHMSMGEMQRVAIMTAAISSPRMIFLDEPASALDSDGLDLVHSLLADMSETGVMLLTHDTGWARGFTDRVVGLRQGRKVLDAPWETIDEDWPSSLFQHEGAGSLLPGCGVLVPELESAGHRRNRIDKLRLEHVSYGHSRERSPVVRDVSFEFRGGRVACVVGPNGSGKTTLLSLIAGILRPQKGRVTALTSNGLRASFAALRSRSAFAFQNPAHQIVTETVSEELSLSLRQISRSPSFLRHTISVTVEAFGLQDAFFDPACLSSGQQKMLSLACCICLNPDICVLDEPELGLDPLNRHNVIELIKHLAHVQGRVVIVATHDLAYAEEVGDDLIPLR